METSSPRGASIDERPERRVARAVRIPSSLVRRRDQQRSPLVSPPRSIPEVEVVAGPVYRRGPYLRRRRPIVEDDEDENNDDESEWEGFSSGPCGTSCST